MYRNQIYRQLLKRVVNSFLDVFRKELYWKELFWVLLLLLGNFQISIAAVLNVPASYPTIQQAIEAASAGDTVLVAPGTYLENINFLGKAITVKSLAGPTNTIIDGNQVDTVVVFESGEDHNSSLEGFTIQNGKVIGGNGGGIEINSSSPIIRNNQIMNNSSCAGAIYIYNASPIIEYNVISDNIGCQYGGLGGIYIYGQSDTQIIGNTIINNKNTPAGNGGGINITSISGNILIKNNIISNNSAPVGVGGGIYINGSSTPLLVQNLIYNNFANEGGGIYSDIMSSNRGPTLINNTIASNTAKTGNGSALYAHGYNSGTFLINNVLVGLPDQNNERVVFCETSHLDREPTFNYNDVYSFDGIAYGGIILFTPSECGNPTGNNGNISINPLFANSQESAFCLKSQSPIIDAGNNGSYLLPNEDIVGTPRILDGNGDNSIIIDMGAFEYNPSGAGELQFNSPIYTVKEKSGSILVTVARPCETSGVVTVDYKTINGTAISGIDYLEASGTLVFQDGQSSASFSIPILDDSIDEVTETVFLVLSNPTGGSVLGINSIAKLIITDEISDYFPLNPGNTWEYLIDTLYAGIVKSLFKSPEVNNIKTRVLDNSFNSSKMYFTSDSDGIRLHRWDMRQVPLSGYGVRNLKAIANPPIIFAKDGINIGDEIKTSGTLRASVPGLGSTSLGYNANFRYEGLKTISVPAGTFDNVMKLQGTIQVSGQPDIVENLYLAKGIGIVKQIESLFGQITIAELQETNTWKHDFAVTKIQAPKKVALSDKTPSVTKTVNVTIQNRSPHLETIADTSILAKLVALKVESLSLPCPAAAVVLPTDKLIKHMPLELKPKKQLSVSFSVTFDCASDPESGTGHEDFSYTATVDHSAIDGEADVHAGDDSCPYTVNPTPPDDFVIDDFPDGTIKDKGCGAKQSDGTLGGQIVTDVVKR